MPTLTIRELAKLRQATAKGVAVNWDKPTINVAVQRIEDVLDNVALDPTTMVAISNTVDPKSQIVKDGLDAGTIPADIVPLVEDWLLLHPPVIVRRDIDEAAISDFITSHRTTLRTAARGMPSPQRTPLIRRVILRRVEVVV